jgi:Ca-activated chloride channel homolog
MKSALLALIFFLSLPSYCQQATERSTGVRLQYVLLNDTSGRTLWPGGIEQQVKAATQFLGQVVTPGSDVGSLVNFSQEFFLDVENSTNPDHIAAKLIREGRHATALYEAVVAAARWLDKQEASDRRKVIIMFSDGDDNASQMSLQETIGAVQKVHIPVFVIAPTVVEHKRQGKAMKELANATGGQVYFVPNSHSFDSALFKHDLAR